MLEILTFEELHREIRLSLVLAQVVNCDDVAVRELTGRARLAEEALAEVGVAFNRGADDLERDLAFEQCVVGAIHDTHPSLPDFFDDLVAADCGQCAL